MSKYLILEFRNAGLFRKNKNTKDKIFDISGRRDRKLEPEFVEPITVNHISNMLHVLFGERPKPENREVIYESIPYLYDKAMSSYVKIDSFKDKNGKFYSETTQLKKATHNSWAKQSYLNWNRIKELLEEDELIVMFINTLCIVFNCDIEEIPFYKIKKMLLESKDERINELFYFLNKKGKKALFDSVYGHDDELTNINKNFRTTLTVLSGLDKISRLHGEIIIPVSDEDILKIKQNKGCATILDGGLVSIKSLKSKILSIHGFTEVKNISLKKQ